MSPGLAVSSLLMGLMGSTHCVVMCGGVVAMTCAAVPLDRRRTLHGQVPFVLSFNAGRIASYGAAGAVVGSLGAALASFGAATRAQLALRFAAGAMMIAVGLYVAGFARGLGWLERLGEPAWRLVAPLARGLVPVRTPMHALALGSLWGFMPCGLVYAALAAATTTGSALGGALTMTAFGLGTLPMLVAMGSAAAVAQKVARAPWARTAFGAAILAFGLMQVVHVRAAWSATRGAAPAYCVSHARP
jgi:sulfite exporter TauE/SafE